MNHFTQKVLLHGISSVAKTVSPTSSVKPRINSIFLDILYCIPTPAIFPVLKWAVFFFALHIISFFYTPALLPEGHVNATNEPLIPPAQYNALNFVRKSICDFTIKLSNAIGCSKTAWLWDTRLPAFVHAVYVTYYAAIYFKSATFKPNLITGRNKNVSKLFAFTLGYFVYDSVVCTMLLDIQGAGHVYLGHGLTSLLSFSIFYFVIQIHFYFILSFCFSLQGFNTTVSVFSCTKPVHHFSIYHIYTKRYFVYIFYCILNLHRLLAKFR
jgi:hypothetical protein